MEKETKNELIQENEVEEGYLTFEPFRIWFIKYHPTGSRMDFIKETGLAPGTAAKIWNDRFPVKTDLIVLLCSTYNLRIEQVVEFRKGKRKQRKKH